MTKSPINITLNQEYPCPCSKKGLLSPIYLMEALGCSRCQNIFAVRENGQFIEEVSSSSVTKKIWYWTGKKWVYSLYSDQINISIYWLSVMLFVLLVTQYFGVAIYITLGMVFVLILAVILKLIFPTYRR